MTQIVAARVTPYVDFRIHRITGPGSLDNGFFALIVPPSASRPHALPRDGRLRFPRRDGTTRRWLAEAEIADLYRDRFRQADDAVSRLTRIIDEALPALAEDAQQPRVVLSLVPTASSDIPNDAKRLQEIETWAAQFINGKIDGFLFGNRPAVRAGLRRARLFDSYDAAPPEWSYAELHTDGAAAATTVVGPLRNSHGEATDLMLPWQLIWATARCLNLAARHAVEHAGAYGDVLLELWLSGPEPLRLAGLRHGTMLTPITNPTALPLVSRHTVSGDALLGANPQAILAVTRLLVTDIVHAMGWPEVSEISDDGALVKPDPGLREWAASADVAVVD